MKIIVIRDVTPCSMVERYKSIAENCCLYIQKSQGNTERWSMILQSFTLQVVKLQGGIIQDVVLQGAILQGVTSKTTAIWSYIGWITYRSKTWYLSYVISTDSTPNCWRKAKWRQIFGSGERKKKGKLRCTYKNVLLTFRNLASHI